MGEMAVRGEQQETLAVTVLLHSRGASRVLKIGVLQARERKNHDKVMKCTL